MMSSAVTAFLGRLFHAAIANGTVSSIGPLSPQ